MSWMNNFSLYKHIVKEIKNRYRKNTQSAELKTIQLFIDDINNEHVKSKKDIKEEFRMVKQIVKNKFSKDVVRDLEFAIIGYDDNDDNNDDNKAKTFAPSKKVH